MTKKIRTEPINIAPDIIGWLDIHNTPKVFDKRNNVELDPTNLDDKIIIYERQVSDWFLKPASDLIRYKNKNKGFIVLMICLSYIEGVEQYIQGVPSQRGGSRFFFVTSMERIYPNKFQPHELEDFYSEARCGLFHNGMVKERIIINNRFSESLEFVNTDIRVNPKKFLEDITNDFHNYLNNLQANNILRTNFNQMYTNI